MAPACEFIVKIIHSALVMEFRSTPWTFSAIHAYIGLTSVVILSSRFFSSVSTASTLPPSTRTPVISSSAVLYLVVWKFIINHINYFLHVASISLLGST